MEAYIETGKYIIETYHADVSRFSSSDEMRKKLGDEFVHRAMAPRIYETREEAERILI